MTIFGIACLTLAFFLYESEERRLEEWLDSLWIKIDDYRQSPSNLVSRFVIRFASLVNMIFDWLWGNKLVSFKSCGVSFWLSWCFLMLMFLFLNCRIYLAIDFEHIRQGGRSILETGVIWYIPFLRQFDIQVIGYSANVFTTTWPVTYSLLFFYFFVIWSILLCIIPHFTQPRYWISAWVVTLAFICVWLWPNMGDSGSFYCFANGKYCGEIKICNSYPLLIKVIIIIMSYVLPSLLISFFVYDFRSVYRKIENISCYPRILARIVFYCLLGIGVIIFAKYFSNLMPRFWSAISLPIVLTLPMAISPILYFLWGSSVFVFLLPAFTMILHCINRSIYVLNRYKLLQHRWRLALLGIALIGGGYSGKTINECLAALINKLLL
ncbi:MAG: hypothetical protein EOM76_10275 [Sphingobacteriia bacterium]|nr:hypothetical protein [Sphingobacteriia bacterium]